MHVALKSFFFKYTRVLTRVLFLNYLITLEYTDTLGY